MWEGLVMSRLDSNIYLEVASVQLDKDYHIVQVSSPKPNISQQNASKILV
jgi:hypothetical protein